MWERSFCRLYWCLINLQYFLTDCFWAVRICKVFYRKISAAWAQIVVKIIFFGVISAASLKFFKGLFLGNIELPDMPMAIIIIGGVIMFLLYDYIFTLAVNIYRKRIKREKIDFRLSEDQNGDEERKGQ